MGSLPCPAAHSQTLRRAGDVFLRLLSPFYLAVVTSALLSPSLQHVLCGSSSEPRTLHPSDVTSHRSRLAKALFKKPTKNQETNSPTLLY